MHRFANPARFMRFSARLLPWLSGLTVVLLASGLYLALVASPPDYEQGQAVRIMYVHVPSAWVAMAAYGSMALASIAFLVWKHPLAGLFTKAVAPVGAGFTALCLVTGSLWGEPMWGTWWVWDARLTSVLVLLFLYLGYLALIGSFDDVDRGLRVGAVLVLVGTVNLPIIKFSVDWWYTLHQPASVARLDGPTMQASMLIPLLVMAVAFTLLYVVLALIRTRAELTWRKVETLRVFQAAGD